MTAEGPQFGPSGYLPPRAAKRARKIMLREPLGLQWAVAAVVAGLVVLAVGGALVLRMTRPPGPPFVPAGEMSAIDPRGAGTVHLETGAEVLVVRAAGGISVFAAPDQPVSWCGESGHLESAERMVWEPSGRLIGGDGASLARLPSAVHDGTIYVNPTAEGQRIASQPERGATPSCGP